MHDWSNFHEVRPGAADTNNPYHNHVLIILLRIEKINKHSVIPAKAGIQSKTLWIPAQGRNDKYKSMFEIVKFIIQRAIVAAGHLAGIYYPSSMKPGLSSLKFV
jgi:hypothetical protein